MGNEKIIKMKCESCGEIMDYNKEKEIIFCPYCGSKDLIIASDKVQIARIKAETEKAKMEYAERDKSRIDRSLTIMLLIGAIVTIVLAILEM